MPTFTNCGSHAHPGSRLTRRRAVQAGAIGLLGLGFNHLAALRSLAAPAAAPRAKNVIYIFLSGGLAQHESFDMKPNAPQEIRGEFRPIPTRTSGIEICGHLPELAKCSHLWSLVRSLTHGSNDHSAGHHIMLTGRSDLPQGFDPTKPRPADWPSIAALAGALLRPRNNLPPAIVLPDKIVHNSGRTIPGSSADCSDSGTIRGFWKCRPIMRCTTVRFQSFSSIMKRAASPMRTDPIKGLTGSGYRSAAAAGPGKNPARWKSLLPTNPARTGPVSGPDQRNGQGTEDPADEV